MSSGRAVSRSVDSETMPVRAWESRGAPARPASMSGEARSAAGKAAGKERRILYSMRL